MSKEQIRTKFSFISVIVLSCVALVMIKCSGMGARRVSLKSTPEGAEVLTTTGKPLGKTPLVLEGEKLVNASSGSRIDIVLRAPRFVERQVTLDVLGDDTHNIRLAPLDENYFAQRLMEDFGIQANDLVRRLMMAQGLAFAGKLQEAEKELQAIEVKYPNLSPIYVLKADIERIRGNFEKSKGYLRRARSVDPRDPVATRLLSNEEDK